LVFGAVVIAVAALLFYVKPENIGSNESTDKLVSEEDVLNIAREFAAKLGYDVATKKFRLIESVQDDTYVWYKNAKGEVDLNIYRMVYMGNIKPQPGGDMVVVVNGKSKSIEGFLRGQ